MSYNRHMNSPIPVIILAAGNSSRMFPLSETRHKGTLPLGGMSLLTRTVKAVSTEGFTSIVSVVNPDCDQEALTNEFAIHAPKASCSFAVLPAATGMGDAVLAALQMLGPTKQFFVIAPYHFGAAKVMRQFETLKTSAAICTIPTETPWSYGIVKMEGERPIGVIEKPSKGNEPSNLKAQALYLLNETFVDILKTTEKNHYSFELALDKLLRTTEVGNVRLDEELPSLKYPWSLFQPQQQYFTSIEKTVIDLSASINKTAIIDDSKGKVVIAAGATIGHAARIVGPAYIGENTVIGDFSLIRHSSIEANSTIGAYTEVARSVVLENSSVHFSYLADSIIDRRVKIGAGFITANKRLDRKTILVTQNGQQIDSRLTNLGAIIGQNTNIGIKTGTMPGVLIGANSTIYPGSTIYESTQPGTVIKTS